jgi:asparagine synthase (glutamine-hydrolysing)
MARLRRRGPDGEGSWCSPCGRARLGHARLAINDLSDAARQPMVWPDAARHADIGGDADGAVALVFNGEIYNAPALRRELQGLGHGFASTGDTEVVLRGHLAWGFGPMLERLAGMFSIVLWDGRSGEAFAAVDHAGMKPLAWAVREGALLAASDCDALRAILPEQPELDGVGLCHVLTLGYCPPARTVWSGVRMLEPGQAMRFVPGDASPTLWRHWSPPDEAGVAPESPGRDRETFEGLFETVVGEHLLSDVPVGLFLSGGLDSTAVALALRRLGRPVKALTLGLAGVDDEGPAAAETAAMLGLEHERVALETADIDALMPRVARAFDQPQGFGAIYTSAAIAAAARERGTVFLAGDGGDEAFAGYTWHRGPPPMSRIARGDRAELLRRAAEPGCDGRTRAAALQAVSGLSFVHAHLVRVMPRFGPTEAAALVAGLETEFDPETYAGWAREHDRSRLPWARRGQRLDLLGFCAGSILPKIDRASMDVGLEMRAPFLDRRLLDWALSRPVESDEETGKPVLRSYLAGRVPGGVLTRPKQGFSLRLRDDPWPGRLARLRASALIRDGVLCDRWEGFVAPDAEYRSAKIQMFCTIAAWYEARRGGAIP